MPIELTEKGWKVVKPTSKELSSLVELGKEEILKQAALLVNKREEFLANTDKERMYEA